MIALFMQIFLVQRQPFSEIASAGDLGGSPPFVGLQ
jgi:hypothetical protein